LTSVVTPDEIGQIRPRLVEFAAQMLDVLPRSDQRAKGELYVRGLLTDGARKSMQPMAERLGVDHQGLQQFVSSSTWDYTQVRANVARWADTAIAPEAYVVDGTSFPKESKASPCVPASTPEPWARPPTVRSGSACRWPPISLVHGELAAVLPGLVG
jgi:SRSO17 transposase